MDTKINVKISAHGEWNNELNLEGDYETIIKPELDRFYEHSKLCMDKIIEVNECIMEVDKIMKNNKCELREIKKE